MGGRQLLLLVVEDDAATCATLVDLLQEAGHRVIAAHDGQHALSVLTQLRPDLVLLDLMLPIMSGWELLAAISSNPLLTNMPVVVLSAYAAQAPLDVACVLQKPVKMVELLAIIERLCP